MRLRDPKGRRSGCPHPHTGRAPRQPWQRLSPGANTCPIGTRAAHAGPELAGSSLGLVPTAGSTAPMHRSTSGSSSCIKYICFPASLLPLSICSSRCPPGMPVVPQGYQAAGTGLNTTAARVPLQDACHVFLLAQDN